MAPAAGPDAQGPLPGGNQQSTRHIPQGACPERPSLAWSAARAARGVTAASEQAGSATGAWPGTPGGARPCQVRQALTQVRVGGPDEGPELPEGSRQEPAPAGGARAVQSRSRCAPWAQGTHRNSSSRSRGCRTSCCPVAGLQMQPACRWDPAVQVQLRFVCEPQTLQRHSFSAWHLAGQRQHRRACCAGDHVQRRGSAAGRPAGRPCRAVQGARGTAAGSCCGCDATARRPAPPALRADSPAHEPGPPPGAPARPGRACVWCCAASPPQLQRAAQIPSSAGLSCS